MATACTEIVCPEGCATPLPEVQFDLCNPKFSFGQISDFFITNIGYPLIDETDPVEWNNRLNLPTNNPAKIIRLLGIGDKPAATVTKTAASYGRQAIGNKDHIVNFKVDEVNDPNYNMMRQFECGKTVLGWYKKFDGYIYGGAKGIKGTIDFNDVIPEDAAQLEVLQGTFEFKAKIHPCRTMWPLQGDLENAGS